MEFQNEWKHAINRSDLVTLEHRLSLFARPDGSAYDKGMTIHGLYFENMFSPVLSDGHRRASLREKFRIVYYNNDLDHIYLQKKSEMNGMSDAESCEVTAAFVENILNRNYSEIVTDSWRHSRRRSRCHNHCPPRSLRCW